MFIARIAAGVLQRLERLKRTSEPTTDSGLDILASKDNDHCYVHGYEPLPKEWYRICVECWHCFITKEELVAKDLEIRRACGDPTAEPMDPDQIYICPVCTHDF